MGKGKPNGLRAGRKLKTHRREQKWANKAYAKSHNISQYAKPFGGASHAKGIVLEKIGQSSASSVTWFSYDLMQLHS